MGDTKSINQSRKIKNRVLSKSSKMLSPESDRPQVGQTVQKGSGAHPTTYSMDIWDAFPGTKRPGNEANQLPQSKLRKVGSYTCIPPIRFHGVHRANLIFTASLPTKYRGLKLTVLYLQRFLYCITVLRL
jgi:hypothetical protein